MPATLLALQIFLILLPGFSAAYVVQSLVTRRSQTDLERVIEALLYSFIIYVFFILLNGGRLPFHIDSDPLGKGNDTIVWHPSGLIWLALITFSFAIAGIAYIRFDGHVIFRYLHLTERTTHNSIWNDIFESEAETDQPVQVELGDGRNLIGVLVYYSDAEEDCSIYLTQAAWVDASGVTIPIPGPGILLTKGSGIRSVSLLDPAEDTPSETADQQSI